jgi:selenocysteine-specific elongation factor
MLRRTQIIDAEVEVLANAGRGLRTRQRVRVHIGTVEALARVSILNPAAEIAPGATDLAQLRFEVPVVAIPNERFIIRSYSPQATIAGGCVIENLAEKHRKKDYEHVREYLSRLRTTADNIPVYLDAAGRAGLGFADLQARTGLRTALLRETTAAKVRDGSMVAAADHFVSAAAFRELTAEAIRAIQSFHKSEPLAKGMPLKFLLDSVFNFLPGGVFKAVLSKLEMDGHIVVENDIVRLTAHRSDLSPDEKMATGELRSIYINAGYEVPRLEDAITDVAAHVTLARQAIRKLFQLLVDGGEIVKVTDEFFFAKTSIESLTKKLREFAASTSDSMIDVAKFKEITGLSRKYAIPLLEYFDRERVTRRAGEKRLIL